MNLYNNLKTKVYLGLILGLVLIPGPVLSETWEANLDLTIPSLEMPSTSALDSRAKQEIMMGFECCWDQKHIEAVKKEHFLKSIEYSSKANQKRSQFIAPSLIEPISTKQWIAFTTLQLADIYTTYRGLKYDCVYEMNPIAGESPSVAKMFFVKTAILWPAIQSDIERQTFESEDINNINLIMGLVVGNNYNVWRGAERNCSKK